ncbi:MAG: UDP-N-acetylmuramoyl-L-alanyl-D-glutamate--2,6-diaminopimelate ligase [Deltaproteobacteria bacterium]|nr:UDP-N-acetylmuramoyl-L-alanyl-D-glutamate--2,6-diaminopimelate ligase [Deltaproteobacteria bacterium]
MKTTGDTTRPPRPLSRLLAGLAPRQVIGDTEAMITSLAYHTEAVRPQGLFAALRGAKVDGHHYLAAAIARGARAVLVEERVAVPAGITQVVVENARVALGHCAAQWFDDPTAAMTVVGITGTNGKTTMTYLLESIWRAAGFLPAVIGTIHYRYGTTCHAAPATTPESYDMQKLCADMRAAGVTHVAMEVSSHGLSQHRVDACHFTGAVWTNLSQDHLDYHGDMQAYGAAKERLFALVGREGKGFAVLNRDDAAAQQMAGRCTAPLSWYGLTAGDYRPSTWRSTLSGIRATIETPRGPLTVTSPLVGAFNLSNILAAVAVAEALQIAPAAIETGVAGMTQVPGRLERIHTENGVTIFVDYAHTPAALQSVLQTLRPLTTGRLITVFGCGGDRDATKRPIMGQVAATGSDVVVVTSDNPRSEDPQAIIAQIVAGMGEHCRDAAVVEPDRRTAIAQALRQATAGDVVLVAGKGHEDYQIIGTERRHFDDREVIRECLEDAHHAMHG